MFKFWKSKFIDKPVDPIKDNFSVYNITNGKFKKCVVVCRMQKLSVTRMKTKANIFYHVIVRADKQYIYSIFRSLHQKEAKSLFQTIEPILNNLIDGLNYKNPILVSPIIQKIVETKMASHEWSAAHVAAKLKLIQFFSVKYKYIKSQINSQYAPDYYTPLHVALSTHNTDVVKAVLSLKPRLDLVDRDRNTVLHFAAMSNENILLEMLKTNAVKYVRHANKKGCTPLHLACYAVRSDNVKQLMRLSLPISAFDISAPKPILDASVEQSISVDSNTSEDNDSENIVTLTEEIINDLDERDMKFGGNALFWAQSRNTINALIELGFPVDTTNLNNENALHIAINRHRLKCMLCLISHGCGINSAAIGGKTPLHYAVEKIDISAVQALIVFDVDIEAVTDKGETARHLAAAKNDKCSQIILFMLNAVGAKRCAESMSNCMEGCSQSGSFDGKPFDEWPLNDDQTLYKKLMLEHTVREALQFKQQRIRSGESEHRKESLRSRIICFDGGGIKGLATIIMLIEIEKCLKHPISSYFNWFAGTSVGSIIATLLASGKSLYYIRDVFFKLKDKVLSGDKPHDMQIFEQILKSELGEQTKMCDLKGPKLIITATLADRTPFDLHLFRNYMPPEQMCGLVNRSEKGFAAQPKFEEQLLWKACRASGAAPYYMRAHAPYLDGALICNNPTLDVLSEFFQYNNALKAIGSDELVETLDLVVSFGTGKSAQTPITTVDIGRLVSYNIAESVGNWFQITALLKLLLSQLFLCDYYEIDRIESWLSSINVPFFRINASVSKEIELDETDDEEIVNLMWETKAYMYAMRDQIQILVELLEDDVYNRDLQN